MHINIDDVTEQVVPPTMLVRAAGRQRSVPRGCIGRKARAVSMPGGQIRVTVAEGGRPRPRGRGDNPGRGGGEDREDHEAEDTLLRPPVREDAGGLRLDVPAVGPAPAPRGALHPRVHGAGGERPAGGEPGRREDPPRGRHRGRGREVKFVDCARLVDDLRDARARGILKKRPKCYAHSKLLIIDELGYLDINEGGADLLFQLVSTRYEQRSTIIAANVGIGGWAKAFGDEVAASTIADGICHRCRIVRITGRSYRLKDVPVERKEEQK